MILRYATFSLVERAMTEEQQVESRLTDSIYMQ